MRQLFRLACHNILGQYVCVKHQNTSGAYQFHIYSYISSISIQKANQSTLLSLSLLKGTGSLTENTSGGSGYRGIKSLTFTVRNVAYPVDCELSPSELSLSLFFPHCFLQSLYYLCLLVLQQLKQYTSRRPEYRGKNNSFNVFFNYYKRAENCRI